MSYRDQAVQIAGTSARSLVNLWAAFQAGRLSKAEFTDLAAATLTAYNRRAAQVADVALAVDLTRMGRATSPLGLMPEGDHERLEVAFATLLARVVAPTVDGQAAVERIGTAEPLGTAQDAYAEGMKRHGVDGWTRETSAGACKICRDLSGSTLPAAVAMYHHTNCSCVQRPVLA